MEKCHEILPQGKIETKFVKGAQKRDEKIVHKLALLYFATLI